MWASHVAGQYGDMVDQFSDIHAFMERLKGLDEEQTARVLAEAKASTPELIEKLLSLVEGARQHTAHAQQFNEAIGQAAQTPRVQHLAGTVAQMGGAGRLLLDRVRQVAPGLAEALRRALFSFNDLLYADAKGLQHLLARVPRKTLLYTLRGCDATLRDHLLEHLSSRAAADLREELEYMDKIRRTEAALAQDKVTDLARRMLSAGELIIIRPEERDEWVL